MGSTDEAKQRDLLGLALVAVHRLPLQHMRPRPLIHVVVDRNHCRHRGLIDVLRLALAAQRVVEHLLGRIDPPAAACALRDARGDALCRERPLLAGSGALVGLGGHAIGGVERLCAPRCPLGRIDRAAFGLLLWLRVRARWPLRRLREGRRRERRAHRCFQETSSTFVSAHGDASGRASNAQLASYRL
eukprot:scaffold1721_cov32-Tisochrysis_lutea.AAC.2